MSGIQETHLIKVNPSNPLKDTEANECTVCTLIPEGKHFVHPGRNQEVTRICADCINEVLETASHNKTEAKCPICRTKFSQKDIRVIKNISFSAVETERRWREVRLAEIPFDKIGQEGERYWNLVMEEGHLQRHMDDSYSGVCQKMVMWAANFFLWSQVSKVVTPKSTDFLEPCKKFTVDLVMLVWMIYAFRHLYFATGAFSELVDRSKNFEQLRKEGIDD